MAIMLSLFGIHLVVASSGFQASRLAFVLVLVPNWLMIMACLGAGLGRVGALLANGKWEHSNRVRGICALTSGLIMAQFGMALAQASWPNMSPAIWIYFTLAACEGRTIWRAQRDGT